MFFPIRFFMKTLQKKHFSVESWASALCREQRCPSKALWLGLFLNTFLNYIPDHSWHFWFVSDFHQFLKLFWGCLTTWTILKICSSTAVAHQNCSNPFDAWLIQSLPYFILRVPDHLNHPPNNFHRHMFTTWKQLSRYFIKSSSSSSSSSCSSSCLLLVLLLVLFLF